MVSLGAKRYLRVPTVVSGFLLVSDGTYGCLCMRIGVCGCLRLSTCI